MKLLGGSVKAMLVAIRGRTTGYLEVIRCGNAGGEMRGQTELAPLFSSDLGMADGITVSAPRGRVDLEALKRPRLGGKEPSDDDYRL